MTEPTTGERIVMNTLEYDAKTLRTSPRCASLRALAAAIDEAVKAEREACAVTAYEYAVSETTGDRAYDNGWNAASRSIADAIRARGNPPPKVRPAPPPPPPSPCNVIISEGSRRIVGRGNP